MKCIIQRILTKICGSTNHGNDKTHYLIIILAKTTGRRAIMSESAGTRLVNTPDKVKGDFKLQSGAQGARGSGYIVEGYMNVTWTLTFRDTEWR